MESQHVTNKDLRAYGNPGFESVNATGISATFPRVSPLVHRSVFRSADNKLWEVYHGANRGFWRSKFDRKTWNRINAVDAGNGFFEIDSIKLTGIDSLNASYHTKERKPPATYSGSGQVVPLISSASALFNMLERPLTSSAAMREAAIILGATGINRGIPFKSNAELGIALAEVIPINRLSKIDNLEVPKIPGAAIRKALKIRDPDKRLRELARAVGSEHLNLVFGIAPTIDDIKDTFDSVRRSDEILNEFKVRATKHQRFRATVQDSSETLSVSGLTIAANPAMNNGNRYGFRQAPAGAGTISGTLTKRAWTSGAWQFYMPNIDDFAAKSREAISQLDALYGVRPDLSVVWESSPFSWLVDWQANIGDVIENASYIGHDGRVLLWAYSMIEERFEGVIDTGHRWCGVPVRANVTAYRKIRTRGTPYGFGITPEQLSDKQWSILAALGLSQGVRR